MAKLSIKKKKIAKKKFFFIILHKIKKKANHE
jgi:hypothetical protein